MFHPIDHPMERGWVGRIDDDRVIHLAAQTLQSLFTGGGSAREHAIYRLDAVRLLAPVLHPPSLRVFDNQSSFEFRNPAAVVGPGVEIRRHQGARNSRLQGQLALFPRMAAVIGAEGALAGYTVCADWRDKAAAAPKDRDFATGLGPVVVSSDELDSRFVQAVVRVDGEEWLRGRFETFDWASARDLAAGGTVLRPGDLIAGPALGDVETLVPGNAVELEVEGIGVLSQAIGRD